MILLEQIKNMLMNEKIENITQKNNKSVFLIGILIGILFLMSAATIWYQYKTVQRGMYVQIYQNGKLIQTLSLTEREPYTIMIEGENGAYNLLEIREEEVGIVDASCPDKLCENMGFISQPLLPITCLPNHLIIQIVGEEASMGLDGIAY